MLTLPPTVRVFVYRRPADNYAEQSAQFLVIMRKICFGTRSPDGPPSHSVMPSLLETARRQNKDRIEFLAYWWEPWTGYTNRHGPSHEWTVAGVGGRITE